MCCIMTHVHGVQYTVRIESTVSTLFFTMTNVQRTMSQRILSTATPMVESANLISKLPNCLKEAFVKVALSKLEPSLPSRGLPYSTVSLFTIFQSVENIHQSIQLSFEGGGGGWDIYIALIATIQETL